MSAEDKFAIAEAISTYFFALDALNDPAQLAASFTTDALWECFDYGETSPAIRLESREQMEQLLALESSAAPPDRPMLRHHQGGLVFEELTAEAAVTRVKVLVTAQRPGEPAPRVRNTATCVGRWRKTELGWRLCRWSIYRDPAA
jgi:SnoaL-like protein